MSLLVLENIKKHFGAQEVLRGASLTIDPGQKIGIVGRNGGGKTTLFRMIAGDESPDWGEVRVRKNARLGVVPQRPRFDPGVTARDYVATGLDELHRTIARYEACGAEMGEAEGEALERLMSEHDRLGARIEELGGWDTERKVETVMGGIGLPASHWDREANVLSGGEKNRVALARELIGGHDLLLLDEPTNHLDLEGIEWLERYLKDLPTGVLIVSHDRRLLTNCIDRIVELERGRLVAYAGNYPKYLQLKAEKFDSEQRAWEQQQDLIRKEESFIKKHMGSQRTAEAKGRAKKLSHVERLEKPHHDVRTPRIKAPEASRGGERVLHTETVSGGYGDNVLLKDVDVRIGRGERVGIVGPNGAGKSTLLKIIAGKLAPLSGEVVRGHGAIVAYYDQDTSHLRDDHTPLEEIRRHYPEMTDQEIRNHLALFLFRGNEVEKGISTLSGGERARLSLALLVLTRPSWFALDEPTNHLDLASRTALEEMLGDFQGAIVCISHDREFLDGVCTKTIEVGPGGVHEFDGNYSAWRAAQLAEREEEQARKAEREAAAKKAAREREEAAARAGKSKKKKSGKGSSGKGPRNPYMFEKLEKKIMKLEAELAELNAAMATEDVYSNPDKLRDTQFRIAEVESELETSNEEWMNWETA
ncbi:MAG: ABC-F family ATP-binding cassette domain-containing protein [Planctomycetota bacterium]